MGLCQSYARCCRVFISTFTLYFHPIQGLTMTALNMTDVDLKGQRVLIREDLNVPVKDGKVQSDARILASLPTIRLALEQGAAVLVCSHLGRPEDGQFSQDNSS